jgi:geranylgeranyl diphosphate synthase, type II
VRGSAAPERVQDFLAAEAERVEEALADIRAGLAGRDDALTRAMLYALETRGKRLRPILCVAAFEAVGGRPASPGALRTLACGIEIVHTYSLVHDDLPCMDDDDLRRGRPTLHRVAGERLAVLAGAALLPLAVEAVLRGGRELGLGEELCGRLVAELCGAAGARGMVGGQFLDLAAEGEGVGAAALERIHRAKTGALLTAALRLGGLAGECGARELAALTSYGEHLGLAFQITDDLLDVTSDAAALGKAAGKDAQLGKATYPSLFGLDGARRLARERAAAAVAALEHGGLVSRRLQELAGYVVERAA